MMRTAALALLLTLTAPAIAQAPALGILPRTNVAELAKDANADPAIKAAFAAKDRGVEARLADARRYTALILKAADAKPGMRVLDVGSGSGYLALLFSSLVGEKGHVDIHNTPGWINQFPSMDPSAQKARIKRANIGWITEAWNGIAGEPGGYDIIVLGQVYHDVGIEGGNYELLDQRLFELLKPGGRLVIEDHDAIPEMPLPQQVNLHRIARGDVAELMKRAGFAMTDLILIETGHDDRRFNVFRPGVRGRTDRFIATFMKPADGKPLN